MAALALALALALAAAAPRSPSPPRFPSFPGGEAGLGRATMGEEEQGPRRKQAGPDDAVQTSMQRVKVYRLTDDGKWDDQGTGHVTIDYIEGSREIALTVVDEEDSDTLLLHHITSDDIYRKQEVQEATPPAAFESLEASRNPPFHDESLSSTSRELKKLPPLDLSSLSSILKTILECSMTERMRVSVAELILQYHDFFPQLVNLFRTCESSGNMDALHMIFRLVKGIILLNSSAIYDKIFSDDFILEIIGALEYDPEAHTVQNHRTFLKEHVVFKEDVILPRVLDDSTMASIAAIIHANNAAVVCLLKDDASFVKELFAKMRSSNISAESKRELSQDKVLVSAGTDILVYFLNQDPNLLRSYIARQENSQEGNSLLGLLVQGMVTDFGEGMHCQFLEILKILMDEFATNMPTNYRGAIDVFHEKHLDKLIDVIALASSPMDITQSTSSPVGVGTRVENHSVKTEILSNICELLCFCVVHHPNKIKVNFLRSNSVEKILTLTHRREKVLVVAAVRFMRTVIARNDELLLSHVIKFNSLKPIIEVFVENGDRYNMLHSVVLELLEYIRKLMESGETTQSISLVDMRKKPEERGLDKEEEDYFNKGSDEEDSDKQTSCAQKESLDKLPKGSDIRHIPARSKSGGLVDYDDDDEGYNPPPKRAVKADEDDEALVIKRNPVDDKQADGRSPKKPKMEPRFICSKIVAAASVAGRRSNSADKQGPHPPSSRTKTSEGNGDVGEEGPGSQNLQHDPGSLDSTHQNGDDCTKDAGNSPSEMTVNTSKATDSEPYSVR
uniref:Serine/threonine-protein phosphatase 4 regulatory subunit 3-like central domain-containing protein n=1 Tax=Oryza nivara TaxID=4536 RepID=A0A0E0H9V4_ORYNI